MIRMSYLLGGDSDDEIGSDPWNVMEGVQEEVPDETNDFIEFKKTIINAKHKLYDANVHSENVPNDMKQDIALLDKYRDNLHKFYIYSVNLQKRQSEAVDISIFPEETQDSIKLALNMVKDFFSKNSIPETIPYSNFIENALYRHPFNQTLMDNDIETEETEEFNG